MRRINTTPSGRSIAFLGGVAFGIGGGVCCCVFIACGVGLALRVRGGGPRAVGHPTEAESRRPLYPPG